MTADKNEEAVSTAESHNIELALQMLPATLPSSDRDSVKTLIVERKLPSSWANHSLVRTYVGGRANPTVLQATIVKAQEESGKKEKKICIALLALWCIRHVTTHLADSWDEKEHQVLQLLNNAFSLQLSHSIPQAKPVASASKMQARVENGREDAAASPKPAAATGKNAKGTTSVSKPKSAAVGKSPCEANKKKSEKPLDCSKSKSLDGFNQDLAVPLPLKSPLPSPLKNVTIQETDQHRSSAEASVAATTDPAQAEKPVVLPSIEEAPRLSPEQTETEKPIENAVEKATTPPSSNGPFVDSHETAERGSNIYSTALFTPCHMADDVGTPTSAKQVDDDVPGSPSGDETVPNPGTVERQPSPLDRYSTGLIAGLSPVEDQSRSRHGHKPLNSRRDLFTKLFIQEPGPKPPGSHKRALGQGFLPDPNPQPTKRWISVFPQDFIAEVSPTTSDVIPDPMDEDISIPNRSAPTPRPRGQVKTSVSIADEFQPSARMTRQDIRKMMTMFKQEVTDGMDRCLPMLEEVLEAQKRLHARVDRLAEQVGRLDGRVADLQSHSAVKLATQPSSVRVDRREDDLWFDSDGVLQAVRQRDHFYVLDWARRTVKAVAALVPSSKIRFKRQHSSWYAKHHVGWVPIDGPPPGLVVPAIPERLASLAT